jgi:hypothetical protein
VWAQWYGGSSYVTPTRDDLEEFSSIRQARDIFWSRADGWDPVAQLGCPCVDTDDLSYTNGHGTEMWLFFKKPNIEDPYWYPDRILRIGPRGGVQEQIC